MSGDRLCSQLQRPEMLVLIAAAPQAGPILTPLSRMPGPSCRPNRGGLVHEKQRLHSGWRPHARRT
jgi:hypothetical protein